MIGIVIVGHGGMAEAMEMALRHVMGSQQGVASVNVGADEALQDTRSAIASAIDAVDRGDGAVLVVDLLGATPGNVARSLAGERIAVLGGANLPMLLSLVQGRRLGLPLRETVARCLETARRHVVEAMPSCPRP